MALSRSDSSQNINIDANYRYGQTTSVSPNATLQPLKPFKLWAGFVDAVASPVP